MKNFYVINIFKSVPVLGPYTLEQAEQALKNCAGGGWIIVKKFGS